MKKLLLVCLAAVALTLAFIEVETYDKDAFMDSKSTQVEIA